jgi:hypothetical protein
VSLHRSVIASALLLTANIGTAAIVTWTDGQLGSGNPVVSGGVTLTTTGPAGSLQFNSVPGGQYTGLVFGNLVPSGSYSLGFSVNITGIEIEIEALSTLGVLPVDSLSGFSTNLGAAAIGYVDHGGTSFDGTTIFATQNDGPGGVISFSGPAFNAFSFNHRSGSQAGIVIERITIVTAEGGTVSAPGSLALAGVALIGLATVRRRAL